MGDGIIVKEALNSQFCPKKARIIRSAPGFCGLTCGEDPLGTVSLQWAGACGIRRVNRIIQRKAIRIGRRGAARHDKRVAAEEAANDRVIETGAKLRDAEDLERVSTVPLGAGIRRHPLLSGSAVRSCAERWIRRGLDEIADAVREKAIALLLAEAEGPRRRRAMARSKDAAVSRNAPDHDGF